MRISVFRNVVKAALVVAFTSTVSIEARAQTISVGGKIGAPVNDSFISQSSFNSPYTLFTKRYTVGPSVELMSPLHLGFEADALYKRSGYTRDFVLFSGQTKVNSWEFPLMFKARVPGESIGAFGNAGISLRRVDGTTVYSNGTQSLNQPLELSEPWTHGFVAGGGVSLRFGSLRFDPELRYTRWGTENFRVPGAFVSNPNQIEYLLGISFGR